MVEDDVALGSVLQRGLAEQGYAVDLQTGVTDAWVALDANRYDVMVLDLGLPDGDGATLLQRLRAHDATLPVLVLTARDGLGDRVANLDAGADDYMLKPFDFPELLARLRALLRRPGRRQASVLTAGSIELDPAAHRVTRFGVLLPLTAREFALLHALMDRKGEVVPRAELLESVWDANYDGLSNVVDVHMSNLRRKLETAGSEDPIETVRGVGYRLRRDG